MRNAAAITGQKVKQGKQEREHKGKPAEHVIRDLLLLTIRGGMCGTRGLGCPTYTLCPMAALTMGPTVGSVDKSGPRMVGWTRRARLHVRYQPGLARRHWLAVTFETKRLHWSDRLEYTLRRHVNDRFGTFTQL